MIDCKITESFLREKKRMCDTHSACSQCELFHHCGGSLKYEKISEAIEIVQKWSDEHQPKTYIDDFLKKFPNANLKASGEPFYCRYGLYNGAKCVYKYIECDGITCYDCWNEVMEDD